MIIYDTENNDSGDDRNHCKDYVDDDNNQHNPYSDSGDNRNHYKDYVDYYHHHLL